MDFQASESDRRLLDAAYGGRKAYHGEMHDHTDSSGTSDGHVPMEQYKKEMAEKKMDFAAILDHRQVRHTYLEAFDPELFFYGTEPGTVITDAKAERGSLHYNMLLPERGCIEKLVSAFPEYEFTGGREGHFVYPSFTHEAFKKIIRKTLELGGFFVIPHPKQILHADDPLEYYFTDYIGIEVFYTELESSYTAENYALYLELLKRGKRVFACAGGDKHDHPDTGALTTFYSDRKHPGAYLKYLRAGDFTAGNAGVRMILTDADGKTAVYQGGHSNFAGKKLIASAGDLHESVCFPDHKYRFVVSDDRGSVCECGFKAGETCYAALPADEEARFYRTEIYDDDRQLLIAMGNPVWNDML